jgi:hypothetical protein
MVCLMVYDVIKAHREYINKDFTKMAFLWHGPLPSPTGPPLLPLSPQNPLDHLSAFIRPYKLHFGDLDLHGPSAHFFLV